MKEGFNIKEYLILSGAFLLIHSQLESEVVYTDVDPDIILQFNNEVIGLDIDDNGSIDFALLKTSGWDFTVTTISPGTIYYFRNAIWVGPYISDNYIACPYETHSGSLIIRPYALLTSESINEELSFQNYGYQLMALKASSELGGILSWRGKWWPVIEDKYLGIKFIDESENYHYGWIRCSVDSAETIIIKDYAYETIPEHAIIAGDTIGATDISDSNDLIANIYSFNNSIYINISQQPVNMYLKVFDLSGKEIYKSQIHEINSTINLNVAQGYYLVELKEGEKRLTKKLFINQ